jgi:hypothetical protein
MQLAVCRVHRRAARWAGGGIAVLAASAAMVSPGAASAAAPASPNTGPALATSGTPAPTGAGHTYYVDSVAGSDGADGLTTATAWRTLARVTSATLVPGDVVAFKRGQDITGSATIGESGTSTNPITLAAYGTGTPPVLKNPGNWYMLRLDGAYQRVTQLKFADGAVFDNADGLGIVGDKYRLSGAVAVTANGGHAQIYDNEFTDVGVGVKTYGAYSAVTHNSFHDLRIAYRGLDSGSQTSYGAVGVSANNSNIEIAYNDFINCRSTDSPYGADGGAVEIEGFDFPKDDLALHHNYSSGSQGFLEVTETTTSDVHIYENVSDDYQQFIAWDTTTTPSGYLAYNNTVVRTRDSSRAIDIYYYRQAGPAPSASWLTLRNNVFHLPNASLFHTFEYPHDHNVLSGGRTDPLGNGYLLGDGDVAADARFANLSTRDFHLSKRSPAWDAGSTASLSSTDLDGTARPVGAARDIGAYERAAGTAGSSLVSEGGFETQTAIGAATTPWFSEGALSYGVDVAAGKAHTGADNGWVASTTSTGWGAIKQTLAVTPNTDYRMTAWIRNSGNIGSGYVGAKTTGGSVLGEVRFGKASSYTPYVINFNSGSNSTIVLHAGFWGPGSTAWAQIDDVTLTTI